MAGRPPNKLCTGRKWQGFMIYLDANRKMLGDVTDFFNVYGVVFPVCEKEKQGKLIPTDRFYRRKYEFYLSVNDEEEETIDMAVKSFRIWLDKQGGIAPSSAECRLQHYEYLEGN